MHSSRMGSRANSLQPSRTASRAPSRAASPSLRPGDDASAALPMMLCNLLQKEFSGSKNLPGAPGGSMSLSGRFGRRHSMFRRRSGEEEDNENGEG